MIVDDVVPTSSSETIYVHADAETLTCKICGKEYFSRGISDPGYCRECEEKMKPSYYVGGPLDGQKVGGEDDN